ncbi:MAG TPA: TerB family tellurite resistance protein [Chryseolinea sp.]|nr:TerB family tellurite resistance protein [Chryseolinea sp.]
MVIHANLPDFILFLYVHMSRADDSYDPTEMAAIKDKMNGLFSAGTDLEKKLYVTIREYNSFDKNKLTELLSDSIRHFSNDAAVDAHLFNDLKEIIQADGKVDQSEVNALETLKRMIDHQSKA